MQTRREKLGYGMTLLPPLEELIPADHVLRKLERVLDLSFIHAVVRDRYCQDNGRPSIDPEVVMRLFLIQALQGIRSVRELMSEVQVNLAYRWFIGYRVEEALPDHSTLSRALDRFGDQVFNALFARSIAQCRESGLVEGRVLHLDATLIRADLDANRVNQPDSPDPDARFGRGPGGRKIPGYKQPAEAGWWMGKRVWWWRWMCCRVTRTITSGRSRRSTKRSLIAAGPRKLFVLIPPMRTGRMPRRWRRGVCVW